MYRVASVLVSRRTQNLERHHITLAPRVSFSVHGPLLLFCCLKVARAKGGGGQRSFSTAQVVNVIKPHNNGRRYTNDVITMDMTFFFFSLFFWLAREVSVFI